MKIILTGGTGMVGEGVLIECLNNSNITEILSVSRKPTDIAHPKLKEYIVPDFLQLTENDAQLQGYDAVFFCAGISSVGVSEENFRIAAYDTTLHFAKAVGAKPTVTFIYVSGGGTDPNGKMTWARIKGQTEADLMKLPFRQAFGYRVGFMQPFKEQKRVKSYYKYFSWMVPVIKIIAPNIINTMSEVGKSMIYAAKYGYDKNIITPKDVKIMAENLLQGKK